MYRLLITLALGTFAVGTAGFVTAGMLGLLAAGLLVLGLLASEIAHRFGRPDKARDAKPVSGAPAKTEGDDSPTGGEAASVPPEHREHT